jgi:hypothetical protein
MSYDLDLFFEPAVRRRRMLEHFAARRHFTIDGDKVAYEHPDTGVSFSMRLRCAKNVLFQRTVVAAEFEVNYSRPSVFGLEAEKELSAFVAAFRPKIFDPQMHGMDEGPYSGEGFLKGWNFGNVFSVRNRLIRDPHGEILSLPAVQLRDAWAWNYECAGRRDKFSRSAFVPFIWFLVVEGRVRRAALWPEGGPILLPKVDLVVIGRVVRSEKRFGLASWAEVEDLMRRAGFDAANDPVDIRYLVKPPPIADWIAQFPIVAKIQYVEPHKILDDELITAARESLEEGQAAADDA